MQKWFLGGVALFGILIIGGLVWAVMSPGTNPSSQQVVAEKDLVFSDANDPVTGNPNATTTLRIFGDFQCPACASAESGVSHVRKTFGDRVKIVWDDFPLVQVHQNAMSGAVAARCAEDQGKFWEYHDILYQSQSNWSAVADPKSLFVTYANSIGLNTDAFSACYDKRADAKISADVAEGSKDGVEGTPTFFINNKRFVGGMKDTDWDTQINAALAGS